MLTTILSVYFAIGLIWAIYFCWRTATTKVYPLFNYIIWFVIDLLLWPVSSITYFAFHS
jgi:hypothetical protein